MSLCDIPSDVWNNCIWPHLKPQYPTRCGLVLFKLQLRLVCKHFARMIAKISRERIMAMAFENTYRGPCVIPCYRNLTHEAFAERLLNQEQRYESEQLILRRAKAYKDSDYRPRASTTQDMQPLQDVRGTWLLQDRCV